LHDDYVELAGATHSSVPFLHIVLKTALTRREKIFWKICGHKEEKIAGT
jgi:hypothetical protein